MHPVKIEFTHCEKVELAQAVKQAVEGITGTLQVLRTAGERMGADWEPTDTSAVSVLESLVEVVESSTVTHLGQIALMDDIAGSEFSDPENWRVL